MRPIDADQLLDFIKFDERVIAPEEHTAQDIVMMIQTAPTITPPPNAPLTLEELREMDREPVWIRNHRTGDYMCRVVLLSNENFIHFTDGGLCENWGYGSHWTAYRRKPEEV